MAKSSFTYYAVQIYDDYSGEWFTYEKFKSKNKADEFLKERSKNPNKNPNAQVNTITINFED